MMARVLVAVALLGLAGAPMAQTGKGSSGKLDTAGKPIPEKCAGLTGDKREKCIKENAGKDKKR